jgi:hypothetical protein
MIAMKKKLQHTRTQEVRQNCYCTSHKCSGDVLQGELSQSTKFNFARAKEVYYVHINSVILRKCTMIPLKQTSIFRNARLAAQQAHYQRMPTVHRVQETSTTAQLLGCYYICLDTPDRILPSPCTNAQDLHSTQPGNMK